MKNFLVYLRRCVRTTLHLLSLQWSHATVRYKGNRYRIPRAIGGWQPHIWFRRYVLNAPICPACEQPLLPGQPVHALPPRKEDDHLYHGPPCVREANVVGIVEYDGTIVSVPL